MDLNNFGWGWGEEGGNSNKTPFGCELRGNEFNEDYWKTKKVAEEPQNAGYRLETVDFRLQNSLLKDSNINGLLFYWFLTKSARAFDYAAQFKYALVWILVVSSPSLPW